MNDSTWNSLINTSFNFIRSPFFHKDTLFITDPKINSIISNIDNRIYYKQALANTTLSFPSSLTTGYEYSKDSLYAVFHINPADISYSSAYSTAQYFVKLTDATYYTENNRGLLLESYSQPEIIISAPASFCQQKVLGMICVPSRWYG